MRKFCIKTGLFTIYLFCATLLVILLTAHFTDKMLIFNLIEKKIFRFKGIQEFGSTYQRSHDLLTWESKQKKGLILGSSTAYRGINPFILEDSTNINWFNAASSGQGLQLSETLLQLVHKRYATIDFLIVDIYEGVLNDETQESCEDWINNSRLPFLDKIFLIHNTNNNFKLYLKSLYLEYKKYFKYKNNYLKNKRNGIYLGKGFVCSPNLNKRIKAQRSQEIKIDIFKNNNIISIMNFCELNKINLIINISPTLKYHNTYTGNNLYPKVGFVQISDSLILTRSSNSYYDDHHLTCEGSKIYSEYLANRLKQTLTE